MRRERRRIAYLARTAARIPSGAGGSGGAPGGLESAYGSPAGALVEEAEAGLEKIQSGWGAGGEIVRSRLEDLDVDALGLSPGQVDGLVEADPGVDHHSYLADAGVRAKILEWLTG